MPWAKFEAWVHFEGEELRPKEDLKFWSRTDLQLREKILAVDGINMIDNTVILPPDLARPHADEEGR